MTFYWIFIITFSWIGTASLQYINTADPANEALMEPLESLDHYPPLPYINYFNMPSPTNHYESIQNDSPAEHSQFFEQGQDSTDAQRKRRTAEEMQDVTEKYWPPNLVDNDKTLYMRNDERVNPVIVPSFASGSEGNSTYKNELNSVEKRSFSPWGGKRDNNNVAEHTWTWKRSIGIREPSMPKRVRFSPWGGKRSGQIIYKPGTKGSKIIFSASVPELTRIISNYLPNGNSLDVAGYQFIPSLDKRHPIKILALSTKMDERTLRDALPFNTFMESIPRIFKPGHPYLDINLKKDGKRKVKFSAWGGKRSPPIIGPIWTPAAQDNKDTTLDTIVLVRNQEEDS
ncbi:uncharacterized protein LOC126776379 isoform X2 [Nymphalis io]|nr:uncharacterized protein LOC126776379 isoform X2 [Nymphalis io]XP_050354816.1 uncharacterized protein LOC126776379 isoform X2 [Nymphalis io]XP_050354817.1 uncharacterized protein LOC126776379 isoform X2 [Nymphalis io]XP_050354818.1 uncharacterized protein LOC126776379 isoform X2 [Nymphalis io]XP_050354819.1 uncharacterized protein LOC126776379 isoform X2 [Nymphalis io]XP_050354821.1 uncharacterized protein LOC126776379 isoform X2 [Nymphalis io]